MKRLSLAGLLAGLLLLTGLIAIQGLGLVANTLNSAGGEIFWLPLVYIIPVACALASWLFLFPSQHTPSLSFSAFAVWISFSINWLLPVGQVGGEIVRARMLIKRRFDTAVAIATIIGDQTLQVATQAIYALLGFVLFINAQVEQTKHSQVLWLVLLGFVLFGFVSGGLYWLQHRGLFRLFARIARKFTSIGIVGNSRLQSSRSESDSESDLEDVESIPTLEERAIQIDASLKAMYQRRDRLLIATLWRFGFRLTAAAETWLAFYFLGHPVTVGEAIILESMGQAIRSAAFLIPGGLGAQEGGIMLIGVALGIPSDIALASSLCKRVRELTLGLPGLIAWQIDEGRQILGSVDGDRPVS